ncbi:MAG: hypothetical protein ABI621_13255 [Chloroflexota bacterium]
MDRCYKRGRQALKPAFLACLNNLRERDIKCSYDEHGHFLAGDFVEGAISQRVVRTTGGNPVVVELLDEGREGDRHPRIGHIGELGDAREIPPPYG